MISGYQIQVLFNGQWGLYQTATSRRIAQAICNRLAWQTRIIKQSDTQEG